MSPVTSPTCWTSWYEHLVSGFQASGDHGKGRCPFHEDSHASLSIRLSDGVWKCHAGCGGGGVRQFAERKGVADPTRREQQEGATLTQIVEYWRTKGLALKGESDIYRYHDASGRLAFLVLRLYDSRGDKTFRQHAHLGGDRFAFNAKGVRLVPYRLPELLKAPSDATVYVVEGEKDVESMRRLGLVATCNPAGAEKWRDEYSEHLRGRNVVILPDNDGTGQKHAEQVMRSLEGIAASVRIVHLPGLREKGDVSDWLAAGGTREALERLCGESRGSTAEPVTSAPQASWPAPIGEDAFHGLAGDIVRAIGPHSETDPVAILLQFLTAFGNVVGRGPHFRVEETQHHMNLFLAVVGASAKARKGTSWDRIQRLVQVIDESWAADRIMTGLSSGEGLISAVRDPLERTRRGRAGAPPETVIEDAGEEDKRLLVVESEFASMLKVMEREGNTLSPIVRQAWDSGKLRTIVKNNPCKATGAHISIIGHITKGELKQCLTTTQMGNGFANRFLWACVKRSKLLPEGGRSGSLDWAPFTRRLEAAVYFARRTGEIRRDEQARAIWLNVYAHLSREIPGLLGSVTARAEAQVMRIACLYALLDQSDVVRPEHLCAALAVWQYCEDSCRVIFGDDLGDQVADKTLAALRETAEGLTRDEIRNLFSRNVPSERIQAALMLLQDQGLARPTIQQTGGRHAERWMVVRGNAENAVNAVSPLSIVA